MKNIYLPNGKSVAVDEEDYCELSKYAWHERGNGYVATYISGKTVYMHRLLSSAKIGEQVDHINRNRMDNRKENLRLCTASQNQANVGKRKNNTSGYTGVTWHKKAGKFQARIRIDGRKTHLGLFSSPEDAAREYDKRAKIEFGEFAHSNFGE